MNTHSVTLLIKNSLQFPTVQMKITELLHKTILLPYCC